MRFSKIAKRLFIISIITTAITVGAKASSKRGGSFDWNPLMDAISQVESEGNSHAKHGKSVGIMQITPVLVAECNAILKSCGKSKRYNLHDRLNVKKSREMFVLFMSKHNPSNSIERAIRIWNGGIHYSPRRTQGYVRKVMKVLKTL